MADPVKLTIDGRPIQAAPGTLVIDAAKAAGIEIPSFCYYEGLTLQAACRMCLVEVEKMPKLMTACTLPVSEGLVVRTDTQQVHSARKYMLEFLLTNHPLDCPVCDKGGECELQDMAFRYGVGVSRYTDEKVHVPEKQYSPVVFFDAPRCILCYRCVRICNEGMGVGALGVINRGVASEIAPNKGDHLECDECGACIDICPVGALTSGIYRYQTRPWEMTHVGTICTHCADGCKTTLGTRNNRILRGNNRDRSGVNGEFLCIKGRYGFDFYDHPERLQAPLARVNGKLEEVSWAEALAIAAKKFQDTLAAGGAFGVIGSNHTTNEENYYLQKFARQVLKTNNIDHHRTGDVAALLSKLAGGAPSGPACPTSGKAEGLAGESACPTSARLATVSDLYQRKAILVLGADLALEHPLLSFQIRANYRHHQARIYAVTPGPVREDKYSAASIRAASLADYFAALEGLRDRLKAEPELVVLFDDSIQGADIAKLVDFGESLGIPVRYVCLLDYSNSRGAIDMGLTPEFLPGYEPSGQPGLRLNEMLESNLDVLWVVGANPYRGPLAGPKNAGQDAGVAGQRPALREESRGFLVVQEMFLTETAQLADVVLPAACAYEKNGTVTNVTGEVQALERAVETMGAKTDLEIIGFLAREMGVAAEMGPWTPAAVFEEIRSRVRGYDLPWSALAAGGAAQTNAGNGRIPLAQGAPARSDHNGLFASGTLGRYSKILNSVMEGRVAR
jgi:NADH-quinone oxidoreductase subunit G